MLPRRSRVALMLALAALAPGCGGNGETEEACGVASEPAGDLGLPDGFPTPSGVTYIASREAGPSTIVDGFVAEPLAVAFDAYRNGLEQAGYDVAEDEREADDAEVAFAGGGADGQVKLRACDDTTSIEITVRAE